MIQWMIQPVSFVLENRNAGTIAQVTVAALTCGAFAVHPRTFSDLPDSNDVWQRLDVWDVTYLPTGGNVCCASWLQDALDAAALLLAADINWPDHIPDTQEQRDSLFGQAINALDKLQPHGDVWIDRANGETWQTPPEAVRRDLDENLRLKRELDIMASAVNLLLGISKGEAHSTECDHCGTRYSSDAYAWYPVCPNCYQVSRRWLAEHGVELEDGAIQNAIRASVGGAR